MTKHLRKCVDMIKENHIKEKDGKLFVECKSINNSLFLNDDEKEEFLIKIRKYGFKDYEAIPVMDRINPSSIHHYEIILKK
jgi:hypothetical protein